MSISSLLCSAVLALSMPRAEYACRHMEYLVEHAEKHELDPEIVVALIHRESRWKPWAESKAGACGLTQVLPKYTKQKVSCSSLKKPRKSIRIGAETLASWVYEYGGGDYKKGLCGYNGGYKCGRRSRHYARFIVNYAEQIRKKMEQRLMLMEIRELVGVRSRGRRLIDELKTPEASPTK